MTLELMGMYGQGCHSCLHSLCGLHDALLEELVVHLGAEWSEHVRVSAGEGEYPLPREAVGASPTCSVESVD